jgi:hypothetical protein
MTISISGVVRSTGGNHYLPMPGSGCSLPPVGYRPFRYRVDRRAVYLELVLVNNSDCRAVPGEVGTKHQKVTD